MALHYAENLLRKRRLLVSHRRSTLACGRGRPWMRLHAFQNSSYAVSWPIRGRLIGPGRSCRVPFGLCFFRNQAHPPLRLEHDPSPHRRSAAARYHTTSKSSPSPTALRCKMRQWRWAPPSPIGSRAEAVAPSQRVPLPPPSLGATCWAPGNHELKILVLSMLYARPTRASASKGARR